MQCVGGQHSFAYTSRLGSSLPLSDEVLHCLLPQRLFKLNALFRAQRARRRDETLEVAEGEASDGYEPKRQTPPAAA